MTKDPRVADGLSRRPLTASKADEALFVNRTSETTTILRAAVELRLNTFVTGPPGSGKTSLLRHVFLHLERSGTPVVYANVERARSIEEAIGLIATAIDPDSPAASSSSTIAEDETDLIVIENAIEATFADQPLVVALVDGADDALTTTLFGRYRDRLWESRTLKWVVASRHRAPAPPADAFFDRVVELEPFSQVDGATMLEVRAPEISDTARARLAAAIGSAQPVFWMLAAQSLALADSDPASVIKAITAQNAATRDLPDRLRVLYDAVRDLGPIHASDSQLLARLDVSRPWVATGLKELEEQGLVHAERDGRRVLYQALRNRIVHAPRDNDRVDEERRTKR